MDNKEKLQLLRKKYKAASESERISILEEAKALLGECSYPTCKNPAQQNLTTCKEHTPSYVYKKNRRALSPADLKNRVKAMAKNAPKSVGVSKEDVRSAMF